MFNRVSNGRLDTRRSRVARDRPPRGIANCEFNRLARREAMRVAQAESGRQKRVGAGTNQIVHAEEMRKTHSGTRTRHGGVIGNSEAGARCRRRQSKRSCDKTSRGPPAASRIYGALRVVTCSALHQADREGLMK